MLNKSKLPYRELEKLADEWDYKRELYEKAAGLSTSSDWSRAWDAGKADLYKKVIRELRDLIEWDSQRTIQSLSDAASCTNPLCTCSDRNTCACADVDCSHADGRACENCGCKIPYIEPTVQAEQSEDDKPDYGVCTNCESGRVRCENGCAPYHGLQCTTVQAFDDAAVERACEALERHGSWKVNIASPNGDDPHFGMRKALEAAING